MCPPPSTPATLKGVVLTLLGNTVVFVAELSSVCKMMVSVLL